MSMISPSPLCQWYPLLPYVNGITFSPMSMVPHSPLCQWYPLLPYANGTPFSPMPMVPPSPLCLPPSPVCLWNPLLPYAYGVINGNKFRSLSVYNSNFFYIGPIPFFVILNSTPPFAKYISAFGVHAAFI